MMKNSKYAAALAGMGLLLGATLSFAGDLEVTVVTVDGKKIREGVVYASDQAVKIGSGGGKTIIRGIPEQRTAVTADVRVGKSGGKDDLRYVGVDEGFPAKGTPDAVKITVKPAKDINAFCSECHPSRGEPVKRGQIPRDIHATGKELTGRYLEQPAKFLEFIEKWRKERKDQPPEPIVLEERIVKVNGKEVKKYFYTCESCHTLHWKTPWTKYSRAAFREMGTLCAGCHY
jgi:hypothetical protein